MDKNIEAEIFKRQNLIEKNLLPYGFKKKNDTYIYSKNILDNTFRIDIEIAPKSTVKGRIIELSTEEEYHNYRFKTSEGGFSGTIKQEFIDLLTDIRKNCFTQKHFISDQANRICDFVNKKYKTQPEFLWEKSPGCGVFRHKNNEKWFGIIMNIPKNKIDKGEEEIEVINIKLDKKEILDLLTQKGFYKAYHMNKQHWISLILDETLDDKTIEKYVSKSYELTH